MLNLKHVEIDESITLIHLFLVLDRSRLRPGRGSIGSGYRDRASAAIVHTPPRCTTTQAVTTQAVTIQAVTKPATSYPNHP
jgi:hypothetical protein